MPKTKISEYSTTNSNNTDINSINIDEGCAPSGINNAIREVMVHLKNFQTNASGDGATLASLVVQGTGSFTGAVTMSAGATLSGTNTLSGSTVMAASLGTSASPSIYFTSDTNTGIFSPTADTVAVATGGSERMRIDTSGNVGIGTSSPKGKLDSTTSDNNKGLIVSGATNLFRVYPYYNFGGNNRGTVLESTNVAESAFGDISISGNTIQFLQGVATERMRIHSGGGVSIGNTTDPGAGGLQINGAFGEKVHTITDGAAFEIDPGNGTVQLITLGASRTPKATNFAAGESITLMVDDGSAYTLTWTDATFGGSGVVWETNGGVAPTLATSGYTTIVLWKVGTQVYGARVGDA